MVHRRTAPRALVLLVGLSLGLPGTVEAGFITSPGGTFKVGIDSLGNLFDPALAAGFVRLADGYDPLGLGAPREAWGVSAGGVSGFADPQTPVPFGVSNIVANGAPTFGAQTAAVSTFLNAGAGNLLRIDQGYSFAADNVLRISHTLTNVSGSPQAVSFRRLVDWDIEPTPFSEVVTAAGLTAPVVSASSNLGGTNESPDPLAPFTSSTGPAGGTFGPNNLGAALTIDLGTLAPGQATAIDLFHGLSQLGQTEADLLAQLQALGAGFALTGASSDPLGSNAAALTLVPQPAAVPEPSTFALAGVGLAALFLYARRRRPQPGRAG
jgi:hypothetical protein